VLERKSTTKRAPLTRSYGEAEFWFSTIKVVTIIGLLILSLILMCGGGPTHDAIGFRYWRNPGAFKEIGIGNESGEPGVIPGNWGKFLAFWNVFVQAAFSFIGTVSMSVAVWMVLATAWLVQWRLLLTLAGDHWYHSR